MNRLTSAATITAVGLTCKAFLNLGFCSCTVDGLPILIDALTSPARDQGQGLLTVANHISTLDDPLMWGTLPVRYYLRSHTMRWALGASEIMFTNPLSSAFFRNGQVVETFRGQGVNQPAVNLAIQKLDQGHWVHIFPESKVIQPKDYTVTCGRAHLTRFKWGFGRMLMETRVLPIVIPIWLTGFDQLMPAGRPFPADYLPRLGNHLSITVGEPVPSEGFRAVLANHPGRRAPQRRADSVSDATSLLGHMVDGEDEGEDGPRHAVEQVRSELTAIAQRAVEALGRSVSGDLLGATN